MHRAHPRLSRASIATALALALALTAAPAAAAGYLKLGDIKGEVASEGQIEILSWSWGISQASGKVSKIDSISIKQGTAKAKGNVEYGWKVEEGESAPPRPGGTEDIAIGVGELQGGDVEAEVTTLPAAAASGTPTGKRQHKPITITKPVDKATPKLLEAAAKGKVFQAEPARGSGSLVAMVPTGTCRAGARYATAEFGTGSRVYKLEDVIVSGCSAVASGGGSNARPMESLSLNYAKVSW